MKSEYSPNTEQRIAPTVNSTLEEAKKTLFELMKGLGGITYGITMQTSPSEFKTYVYKNVPCYGYLRVYGEHSTRPNDPRPTDLPIDYPLGTPVFLYVAPFGVTSQCGTQRLLVKYPYRKVPHQVLEDNALFFDDLSVDSTLLLAFIRAYNYEGGRVLFPKEHSNLSEEELLILNTFFHFDKYYTKKFSRYDYQLKGDVKKYLNGEITFETGPFNQRFDYNRPEIDYLWGKEETFPTGKYTLDEALKLIREKLNG